ncbi:MAG: HAD family hydrolase [Planctomycetota bacterium]
MNATPPASGAAFVRVEETLLPGHAVRSALYLGLQAPGVGGRLARWGGALAAAPAAAVLALGDRRRLRRLAGLALAGLTRDRVEELSREYYERFLAGALRPDGLAVLERARAADLRVVLFSRGLARCLEPLAAELGADALVASEPEYRDGVATGRLLEPEPEWAAELARRERIQLSASYAYGADLADLALLEAVGFPCAVNPDPALRRRARDAGWPVLAVRG